MCIVGYAVIVFPRPSCDMCILTLQPHPKPTQHTKLGHISRLLCCVFSHSVVSNSLQPHGLQPARSLWSCFFFFFQARILESVAISSSKESFYPGIELRSPMSLALYPLSHQGSPGPDLIPFLGHLQDSWVHLMRASCMVYKPQEILEDKPSSWTRNLKHHSLR